MVHCRTVLVPLLLAATPAAAQVASVQLSHSSLSLPVGARQTVFATAYSGSGAPVGAEFRWASSDEAVVRVEVSEGESDFAEIVAVGPGSARVTVRAGSRAQTVVVEVTGAPGTAVGTGVPVVLNIDPATVQLLRGETQQLRPVFLRADGEPAAATAVTWSSLNPAVANVDAASGLVVGIATGQGAIQLTAGSLSKVAIVEVADEPFGFPVPVLGLPPDGEVKITVVVPGQRGRIVASEGLTWRSSDEQVVRVTPLGVAHGVAAGGATIVVEGYGQVRELPVRVHRAVAFADATPGFSRGPIQIPLHGSRPFRVVSRAADETEIPDAPVIWSVADTTVAVFDPASGELTGRRLGTTTLLARPGGPGLDITWQIEVIAGGIKVTPERAGFGVGEAVSLEASFVTESGATVGPAQGIQWITENANVAQVDGEGRITGTGPGRTRIVARTQWGRADTSTVFVQGGVLFTSSRTGSADLFTLDPGAMATEPRQITNTPSNDATGAWSPDGSRIAFASDREGNYDLYVADADGENPRRLTTTPDLAELMPDWMPDGRRIVYAAQESTGRMQIWMVDVESGEVTALTTVRQGTNHDPAVSPDGSKIAFTSTRNGNYEVYLMDPDGQNAVPVFQSPEKEGKPAWFPNGTLAFVQERTVRNRPVPVVVRPGATEGAPLEVISPPDLPVTDFAVSPRGDELALEVTTPGSRGRFERRIYILRSGTAPTLLPAQEGEQQSDPAYRRPVTR